MRNSVIHPEFLSLKNFRRKEDVEPCKNVTKKKKNLELGKILEFFPDLSGETYTMYEYVFLAPNSKLSIRFQI